MDVKTYLSNLLQGASEYAVTDLDVDLIDRYGLSSYIVSKLFSKKFRKWKVDPKCEEIVKKEVDDAILHDRPIEVFFAQGCYKLWSVASAPNVNWAEFFNFSYIISYLAPIAASYKRGVNLTYYLLTVLPQTHNNMSETEVVAYLESFQKLIAAFRKYLPSNFNIRIERDLDTYSRREYNKELSEAMKHAHDQFYKWPVIKQKDYIRRARLNIKWDGVEDWDKLDENGKEEKVEKAVLYEYAATQILLEKDKKNRGVILSTLPKDDSIGLGSTSTSVAKPWVGEGVLEESENMYHARILSPSQYVYAKSKPHKIIEIDLIHGRPFKAIHIYPERFDFSEK